MHAVRRFSHVSMCVSPAESHIESAPQTMWLRLFFLAAAVTYATLSLNYGGDGLFSMLLSCITHMMDVVALVFGHTQLSIDTWG